MNICFNVNKVGLANNGGSRTLVLSAEAISGLPGHRAFFFCGKSHYDWHDAKIECIGGKDHPPCDVSVATGYNSVPSVTRYAGKRAYFIRGFELWKANEAQLLDSYRSIGKGVFANSTWLVAHLRAHGVGATLQYPGLDWNWFRQKSSLTRRPAVGALRNTRHRTKRHDDIDKVEQMLGTTIWQLNKHIKRPTPSKLNSWYNDLRVWFAPTELEGLHNPPMEAALAGCALVCTDHPRSGMQDYAVHNETALVYPARKLEVAHEYIRKLLENEPLRMRLRNNMVHLLREKMGTRMVRMREFVDRLGAL